MSRWRLRWRVVLPLLVAAAIGVAWMARVRVPEGTVGLRVSRWGRTAAILAPGTHWRVPGLERVHVIGYPRLELGGSVPAVTPEGLRLLLPYRFSLRTRTELLLGRAADGAVEDWPEPARAALAGAWQGLPAEIGTARFLGADGEAALRQAAIDHLGPLGLEVATLEVGAPAAIDAAGRAALDRIRIGSRLDHSIRIFVIGWDGADWGLIDPLMEAGRMPNLARLRQRAAWGRVRSGSPTLSPLLWTTVATGKRPEEHGIVDFLVRDPVTGRYAPISSPFRRVKAIWNIFTEYGLSSSWIAWWATWPAEPIDGEMVTDRVSYSLFPGLSVGAGDGFTHPPELLREIETVRRRPADIDLAEIGRFVEMSVAKIAGALTDPTGGGYTHPLQHLRQILASTATYHRIALHLLDSRPPRNLFAIYYQGIDEVNHRFAQYQPPRMERLASADAFGHYRDTVARFYAWQDELLGELLDRVPEEAFILLLSDHGFAHGSERPRDLPPDIEGRPGKWHTPDGIWLLAGPGVEPGRRKPATLYQIAPTLLALVGLPAAADMHAPPLEGTPATRLDPPSSPFLAALESVPTYESDGDRQAVVSAGPAAAAVEAEMMEKLRSLGYIGAGDGDGGDGGNGKQGGGIGTVYPDGGTTLFHSNLAASLMLGGDLDGARGEFERALELQPESVPALTGMSELAARAGDPVEALRWARQAIAAGLDVDPPFYSWTAGLFLETHLAEDGRDFFLDLYQRRGDISEVAVSLGRQYDALGDPGTAERYYWAGLESEPACLVCLQELFDLLDRQDATARLEAPIRRALDLGVREILPWNWLGLLYKRQGRSAEAEEAFVACLELYPEHTGTLANLGSLYIGIGRIDAAIEVLERAWSIDAGRREVLVNLLSALFQAGRRREAEDLFHEVEGRGTPHASIYNAMAYGYHFQGLSEQAAAMARTSLQLDPEQPEADRLRETIFGGTP